MSDAALSMVSLRDMASNAKRSCASGKTPLARTSLFGSLILMGVSRSGKTPTCLYLAMQYKVLAANYPLTEDDFMEGRLPEPLKPFKEKLFGLSITPERLHQIREERRPGSKYASIDQCRREITAAEALYRQQGIQFVDSTAVSIEELAIAVMQQIGMKRGV